MSEWSKLVPKAESSTFLIITGAGRGHSAAFLCTKSSHQGVGRGQEEPRASREPGYKSKPKTCLCSSSPCDLREGTLPHGLFSSQ